MGLSAYRALVVFLLSCGIAAAATGPKEAAPAAAVGGGRIGADEMIKSGLRCSFDVHPPDSEFVDAALKPAPRKVAQLSRTDRAPTDELP